MNKTNLTLGEKIQRWNESKTRESIIISASPFDEIFFDYESLSVSAKDSSLINLIKENIGASHSIRKVKINFSDLSCWNSTDWILIDKKQIQEFFEVEKEKVLLEIKKGSYQIFNKEKITEFFANEQKKFSAIVTEIKEKIKNKKFSDSDKESIFGENFLFYMEACGNGNCYCEHPVCVPQCSDVLAQALYHVENCFEKVEGAENYKNVFLADCNKINWGERENTSNSRASSLDNLSQSIQTSTENQEKIALINSKLTDDQITDPDQISQNIKEGEKLYSNNPNSDLRKEINKALTKLFEIDPVKACQNIIAIIDEKLKEVQKLQLVLDQRTIFKIEQLKRGEIVDRDVIINNKDKIFQEIEDKINEKKTNLSVGSYSKKSSLLDIFLLLIFISLGAIVLITVWKSAKKTTRK